MIESTDALLDLEVAVRRPRAVPVGLVTTDDEIWVVVSRGPLVSTEEIDRPASELSDALSICREVRPDGTLRLARIDVEREPFLKEILDGR